MPSVLQVLVKPVRPEWMLRAIRGLVAALAVLLAFAASRARAETFPFTVAQQAEVIADLRLTSPGSDWSKPGREAALANVTVDDRPAQQVMLYGGESRHTYSVFLGTLAAGDHRLTIERNARFSAPGSDLAIWNAQFREVPQSSPDYQMVANAPVLYARAGSVGQFTDVPLMVYCERLTERRGQHLQYTVIFSNEDGGTSTRALMARWGRTTDIEYVYRAWLDRRGEVVHATIQIKGHEEMEFRGRREGMHPLLIPSTLNNMVSGDGTSEIRYQLAPVSADLASHSREEVMDEHPLLYRVMAEELAREGKLRPYGSVEGEKISDPKNYLYVEARANNRNSALSVLVRLQNAHIWYSSSVGRAEYAVSRDGWFRTAIELPPATRAEQVAEFGFECIVNPEPRNPPAGGTCRLEAVSKVFFLDDNYAPQPGFWRYNGMMEMATGQMAAVSVPPPPARRKARYREPDGVK